MKTQVKKNMEWFRDKIHLITWFDIIGQGGHQEVVFMFNINYPSLPDVPMIEDK